MFTSLADIHADEVDDLLQQLLSDSFATRQKAQADLLNMLPNLNGEQLGRLRMASEGVSLEQTRRVERVLSQWSTSFKPVRDCLNSVRAHVTNVKQDPIFNDMFISNVTLDGVDGVLFSNNVAETAIFGKIQEKYTAVEQAAKGGNLRKLKEALQAMESTVGLDRTALRTIRFFPAAVSAGVGGFVSRLMIRAAANQFRP